MGPKMAFQRPRQKHDLHDKNAGRNRLGRRPKVPRNPFKPRRPPKLQQARADLDSLRRENLIRAKKRPCQGLERSVP